MMNDDVLALTRVPWRWEWVPSARQGEEMRAAWTEHMVALFEDWTREGLAAARSAWPADAGAEFPVGRGVAEWLRERADQLPTWAQLAWGAAFVEGRPRWAPVPVVVEFCQPQADDPVYLMERVGATGRDGDAREPVVDYVTTPIGDGVRVFALGRTEEGAAYGRVDAAMRLDVPPSGVAAGISADVLLTTRVFEMGLMAVIGPGVEQLMQLIAAESAPQPDASPARLRFVAASEGVPK
jgi:hypothetical protein